MTNIYYFFTCIFLEWISTTKLTNSGLVIEDDEDEKDDERKNGSKRDISPIHFPKSQSPARSVGKSHLFTLLGSVGKSHLFARYMRVSIISARFAFNFSFLNVVFFHLFYDNITFQHLFIIIKCPAELNFDCKILIMSVLSTFVTELLLRGYIF